MNATFSETEESNVVLIFWSQIPASPTLFGPQIRALGRCLSCGLQLEGKKQVSELKALSKNPGGLHGAHLTLQTLWLSRAYPSCCTQHTSVSLETGKGVCRKA